MPPVSVVDTASQKYPLASPGVQKEPQEKDLLNGFGGLGWLFFFKIYLFHVCEYTVTVFRHTRRGHRIPLQMVVSYHVVAGN